MDGGLKWLNVSADVSGPGRGNSHTQVGSKIPSWLIKDNLLVIGPNKKKAAAWFDDSAQHDTAFSTHCIRESPLSLRIDFGAVMEYLNHRDSAPSEKNRALLTILNHLDQFILTAGRLNSDRQIENFLEPDLADPPENSLRGLFRLLQ